MNQEYFQLNPAISIEKNLSNNSLQIGLMSPNLCEVEEGKSEVIAFIDVLKSKPHHSKSELLDKIKVIFEYTDPLETFNDLKDIKIFRPVIEVDNRYARHELYFDFAGASSEAQGILKTKSVLLVGVGGIGSSCAMLLGAAGVGRIILADSDKLELSNLTRTTLFEESDLGYQKVVAAKKRLELRNNNLHIEVIEKILNDRTKADYVEAFSSVDMVILSGDSGPEVHKNSYLLSKEFNTPIINAGYIEHCGVIGPLTIGYNKTREAELNVDTGALKQLNQEYKAASFGPLNSMVSSMAVNETIRHFLSLPTSTLNQRLVVNSYTYEQTWEGFQ